MMKKLQLTTAFLSLAVAAATAQNVAARFDMTLTDGQIQEQVSNQRYQVVSQLPAFDVAGLDGKALRFDGFSNYVQAGVSSATFSGETFSFSVLLAVETYPMMVVDVAETTPTYATICGNLDAVAKKGFALELSSQGDLRLTYAMGNGYTNSIVAKDKLDRGEWVRVTATFDKAANAVKLYIDEDEEANGKMSRSVLVHNDGTFFIGKDATVNKLSYSDKIHLNTFCGLIDDISLYNKVLSEAEIAAIEPRLAPLPDFSYPASRYAESLWRPQFHGMPSGGWTNETHGMIYSNGRYHVFFQKNANGPYMSRLHWGHISSENLYQWRDEPIAIYPGEEPYDIKGCWSGCVTERNGKPTIFYTAVDNAKATIAEAEAEDATLVDWDKDGVVINGRPAGLSDDFRDPYYFTAGGREYIIVGTSKDGIGACTLHELKNGSWTNDGKIFFQGTNLGQHGKFWEMPNVTPMANGKWLFTCTPLGLSVGVRTLCWVGTIGADGKFTPDANGIQFLEMGGISRDGYGLLSPTIYQQGGKTLLLGIVPDKLATADNVRMGWAHNYSLPREISLDANGQLVQKPYSGLAAMRSAEKDYFTKTNETFTQTLEGVSGHHLELLGSFTVAEGQMGFRFLKSGERCASLTYDATLGTLTLDLTKLDRTANDGVVYGGIYKTTLPVKPAQGETLKLNVFLDGSILDIFVNDRWAYSVRVFPTNAAQTAVEAFSTVATSATVQGWNLDAQQTSALEEIQDSGFEVQGDGSAVIYNLQGQRLTEEPRRGIFVRKGKVVYVR